MSDSISNFDILTITTASITLVVTSTWNSLFKDLINSYFPKDENDKAITGEVLYAFTLTFVLGMVVYLIKTYGMNVKEKITEFFSRIPTKIKVKI